MGGGDGAYAGLVEEVWDGFFDELAYRLSGSAISVVSVLMRRARLRRACLVAPSSCRGSLVRRKATQVVIWALVVWPRRRFTGPCAETWVGWGEIRGMGVRPR